VKKYLLILFVTALAISACTTNATATESPASLAGAWKLTAYGPAAATTPAVPDTEAGLTFNEDGTVTGNSGCNGLGGTYTVEGDQITFSEIVSTLMACDDPRIVQENSVQQVLNGAATFKIEGNTLTLTNSDMALVLTR
jgi:heat shock protein HslJ